MIIRKWLKLTVVAGILIGLQQAKAQTSTSSLNPVTTATPFLRISPDARGGAMGDANIAVSPDAYSGFWNAAKLPFATSNGAAGLTYTPWLKDVASDVYLLTAAGYYKPDDQSAIHGGIRYFSLGQIQFTDDNGNSLGSQNPREFSVEAGYSRKVSERFGVGATLRYINSSLVKGTVANTTYKAGTAVAGDISAYYHGQDDRGEGLTAGLTISNLGSKISYTSDANSKSFLPANLGLGGAYTWAIDEQNKFALALDINHLLVPAYPNTDGMSSADSASATNDYYSKSSFSGFSAFGNGAYAISSGAEYGYNDQFFVRAGYHWASNNYGSNLRYFTAGIGLKYNVFGLNFSYLAPSGTALTRNPLSNTLRFSLIFDLGSVGESGGRY
ncbi:MAG: type IX secretion system outer membrane channel protein PorV [Chitinophagaceae bacterium]|jgi:hypothetical protein|nr:type IX secretion system outer membrane channel protein PorV [Chitinophagaceae bacterium]